MKRIRTYLLLTWLMFQSIVAWGQKQDSVAIAEAVDRMMTQFPASQLRDLYKSFFQDQFGLEHLIADSTGADRYMKYELKQMESESGNVEAVYPDYEPNGYRHNFYRVNMQLIHQKRLPYEVLYAALMESAKTFKPIAIEDWIREWKRIEGIIAERYPALMENGDKAMIDSLLKRGEYAVHHSRKYVEAYHPHYRIIERSVFERRILPLLKTTQNTISMDFITEKERIYSKDAAGNVIAEITFPVKDGIATIDHTFVDASLRGQGIAGQLMQLAVDKILADGNQLAATCSYAVTWLQRHPEYKVVDTGEPVSCKIDGRR